ncbi:sodium:calcium antiporter [Rubrobacter marinus]|uniref:Sodium:calcium antiporter n=1 Tax=Rubrobacter marinus TaxID=2653852 RepID=A0A6G8PW34_9ACTN|nr:sodium:calcium antiporter [Rubrobacter marinus]QIN78406.1 sodium:calcium antiporter [Rubrobacter marinus]
MNAYALLVLGVLCAGLGGEIFVRGIVGVADWARVPPGIVAATFAAFATSSPELSVAVNAALEDAPNIALGDALGSNVVNVALILGATLLFSAIRAPRDSVRRDLPVALLAPVVVGVTVFDGEMSRADGVVLLGLFVAWLVAITFEARKQRSVADEVLGERSGPRAALLCAAGLALLVAAGRLIVTSAEQIAPALGLDYFVVGATVVAAATGTPELAVALVSALRGHEEVGLGTILGSNVFNGLFVVGLVTVLSPFRVAVDEVAVGLVFGLVTVAATWPGRDGLLGRRRGASLLALYAAYLTTILWIG